MPAIREKKVQPADAKLHTTEPVYHADDIALGLTFQIALDERRSLAAQTHLIRDAAPKEIDTLLDKLADAFDRLSNKYRLKQLRVEKAQRTKALAASLDDSAATRERWESAWIAGKRHGPFRPDGNQTALLENYRKSQQQARNDLNALDAEIKVLETEVGA